MSKLFKKMGAAIGRGKYKSRQHYIFHMRAKFEPVFWPVRNKQHSFMRFCLRRKDKFRQFLKATIKSITEIMTKTINIILKYAKIIIGALTKYLGKFSKFMTKVLKSVSAFMKKYISPLFSWVGVITKLFKKKEEE